MEPKTFLASMELISSDPKKAKSFLKDKRITQEEKAILQGYLYVRKNQFTKVITLFKGHAAPASSVAKGLKEILLGLSHHNLSHFREAIPFYESAVQKLNREHYSYFWLIAVTNLFMVHLNLQNEDGMREALEVLLGYDTEHLHEKVKIVRCFFNYHSFKGDYPKADEALHDLDRLRDKLSQSDQINLLIDHFVLEIKRDQFDRCYGFLEQMKSFRDFNISANFNYMKKLLDHAVHGSPIYFQEDVFKEHPVLFLQIKCIRAMEEHRLAEAQTYWNQLREVFPSLYQKDFQFRGQKSLFSLCVEKHRHGIVQDAPVTSVGLAVSVKDKIISILAQHSSPVHKETLYQLVFEKEAETKGDLQRLSKNIYKLNQSKEVQIDYKKGCYFLKKKAS